MTNETLSTRCAPSRPLAIAVALALLPAAARAGSVQVDAGRGPVAVELPASHDPSEPVPLVLLLHGLGQSGATTAEQYYDLDALGDQHGFAWVAPDAEPNAQGSTAWNPFAPYAHGDVANDSFYLRSLVEAAMQAVAVDAARVYVIGQSLGGIMAYRVACDSADLFAAVVSHAGGMPASSPCAPSEPVHLLHVHGTADGTLPYGGSPGLLGAVQSVETWASLQGCALAADTSDAPFDFDGATPGAETHVARYGEGCAAGGSATLWTQVGTGHVPWPTSAGRQRLWSFLDEHARPTRGTSFCEGDAGAPCPCGNAGAPGHGCDNAAQTGGVRLEAAAFAPDGSGGGAATLSGSGYPAGAAPAVVAIRSSARANGGVGTPFGDGLACLAPPVVRVAAGSASGGTSTHALSHGAGAGTFHYQLWYRSGPAVFCDPSSAFNLSNGLSLAWP